MFTSDASQAMARVTRRDMARQDRDHPKVVEYYAKHGPLSGPDEGLYKIVWDEGHQALIKRQDEFGPYGHYFDRHDWSFVHAEDKERFERRRKAGWK